MEEQFNELDKFTSKWVKEAGVQKPSASFVDAVMESIVTEAKPIVYRPLISKKTWVLVSALTIGSLLVLNWVPMSESGHETIALIRDKINFQNPISNFKFSRVSAYALGFLALFLFQIPYLKRMMRHR